MVVSVPAAWALAFIGLAGGIGIGTLLTILLLEINHDCLPHDPRTCKEVPLLKESS